MKDSNVTPTATPGFARTLFMILLLACGIGLTRAADDYLGAETVLQRAIEEREAPESDELTPAAELKRDLAAFREAANQLPPDEAARQWMALADRFRSLDPAGWTGSSRSDPPPQFKDLIDVLPPPPAWNALESVLQERPRPTGESEMADLGLRLLVHTLTGNAAARMEIIEAIQETARKGGSHNAFRFQQPLNQIGEALLATVDDPDVVLGTLDRRLATVRSRSGSQLSIPNLVALVGEEKAEAFLRRALNAGNVQLQIESGSATSRLARRLTLELMESIKEPQWALVNSLDAVELYEALDAKFNPEEREQSGINVPGLPLPISIASTPRSHQERQAQGYFLLGLIGRERIQDAAALALKLGGQEDVYVPHEALRVMERAGHTRALADFFHELLSQNPELNFWNEYVDLSAKSGQTQRMLELARSAAQREDTPTGRRATIHQHLYAALLAADEIEEGIDELRRVALLGQSAAGRSPYSLEDPASLGIRQATIGRLLDRNDWIAEGIAMARQHLITPAEAPFDYGHASGYENLTSLLLDLERGAEAEAILAEGLANDIAARQELGADRFWQPSDENPILTSLARVYHRAGHHNDVLLLLDQAPNWGVSDLAGLIDDSGGSMFAFQQFGLSRGQPSIAPMAGVALIEAGRTQEARKIANALLDMRPGSDRGYELLFQLGGDDIPGRLDDIFRHDPFEERPLIWKARWLLDQGQLEEAERVARQAIAIDPSDGEQGPGDRMRVYAVLADIREARGDSREAGILRGAVRAVRLSEQADTWYAAGLLKRAVNMYQEALGHFADAYCIQSRLAIRLAELGLHEEAEAHYRRAYELMPDSFGRIESHCFGCEKAFDGQRAQNIAEKVFTDLAARTPDKPQVHYLLGYLRTDQGRYADALPHFRTAVELDPDYLNAWKKIQEISGEVHFPMAERERVTLELLRLDPLSRRTWPDYSHLTDLRALWAAVEEAATHQPTPPEELLVLTASKADIDRRQEELKTLGADGFFGFGGFGGGFPDQRSLSPQKAIAQNGFIQAAVTLVDSSSH
ncbi:MAG TPA: tetratricopeptide repeat protein [Methylomirabilota bacterium]|nr:tetratricopeptide repeat protein [Methylomirabilota bacterium]